LRRTRREVSHAEAICLSRINQLSRTHSVFSQQLLESSKEDLELIRFWTLREKQAMLHDVWACRFNAHLQRHYSCFRTMSLEIELHQFEQAAHILAR